jgi:hypothetical protein
MDHVPSLKGWDAIVWASYALLPLNTAENPAPFAPVVVVTFPDEIPVTLPEPALVGVAVEVAQS